MPKVALYSMDGTSIGDIELKDEIFGVEVNKNVLHQVVKMQLANKRQGTQSALTRAEVRGGGAKPWRQKGTSAPTLKPISCNCSTCSSVAYS